MQKITAITLAGAAISSVFLSAAHAEDSPSLSETLAWMDSTYNPHPGGSWGHGRKEVYDGKGNLLRMSTTKFISNGCQLQIEVDEDPLSPKYKDDVTDSYSFNLRDIDPHSIKIFKFESRYGGLSCDLDPTGYCDTAEIDFETRNEEPVIDQITGSSQGPVKTKTFESFFDFDDVKYMERFAKAFRHAVQLCGGKPSTF